MNINLNPTSTAAGNALCPVCGQALYDNGRGNKECPLCGYHESAQPHTANTKETQGLYGWICPKCGAVMSPFISFCPNCTKRDFKITYEPATCTHY